MSARAGCLVLWVALAAVTNASAQVHAGHEVTSSPAAAASQATGLNAWSQAEVRRIDLSARKITLKHGPLLNLGMDPMTMVFRLRDDAVFELAKSLKQGDHVEFVADYDKGLYLVRQIRPARTTARE